MNTKTYGNLTGELQDLMFVMATKAVKTKKSIIISISIVFSLFVIWQMFSIYTHKGNLSFTICNLSDIDSPDVEIYVDGEKVFSSQLGSWHTYTSFSMCISPNNHVAIIKINGNVSQEIKFNTILFTRIFIDYSNRSIYNEDGIRFDFSISKWPFHFLA